jgi:hypothetical protein
MAKQRLALVLASLVALAGCGTVRQIVGVPAPSDPSVTLKSAETRWLLIRNPRFGDVPSEPEYVWVEEDKVPFTLRGLIDRNAIVAPPEVVARYGAPPGGGKISGKQGVPYQAAAEPPRPAGNARSGAIVPARAVAAAPAAEAPKRGYVVYVDPARIVVDLTAADGLRPGSLVSLRRDRIPLVHPVTGEVLGDLDDEVATARVTEIREKFSVAEIQSVAPGSQVQVRDRVIVK